MSQMMFDISFLEFLLLCKNNTDFVFAYFKRRNTKQKYKCGIPSSFFTELIALCVNIPVIVTIKQLCVSITPGGGGGTQKSFGWGCATGTLKPLTFQLHFATLS